MRADACTAEVVGRFAAQGIESILLKGPVIARWLYRDDPASRPYGDVDLLVRGSDEDRASTLLEQLGFRLATPPPLIGEAVRHARVWFRARDGAEVDLHTTVHHLEMIDRALVWRAFRHDASRLVVHGCDVLQPGESARLLHLVLEISDAVSVAAHKAADLERACGVSDEATWRAAAALAARLGALDRFALNLRSVGCGGCLADRLDLPSPAATDVMPSDVIRARLRTLPIRRRAFALARLAVPPTGYMRIAYPVESADRFRLLRSHTRRWRSILRSRLDLARWS